MNLFDQVYSKLFGNQSNAAEPVTVRDTITRSESFLEEFEIWKHSLDRENMIEKIKEAITLSAADLEAEPAIVFYRTSHSNGIAIACDETFSAKSFQYLLDYLSEKVKNEGYVNATSKETLREWNKKVNKTEMHYLKPKNNFNPPIDQKYGNVQLSLTWINNRPDKLKILVNAYNDRNYSKALDFEKLIDHIF